MKLSALLLSLTIPLEVLSPRTSAAPGNILQNGGFNDQGFPYPNDLTLILAPWRWSNGIAYTWANNSNLVTLGPDATVDAGGSVGFGHPSYSLYQDVVTTPGQIYQLTITAHSRGPEAGHWLQPLWEGNPLPSGYAKQWEWTAIRYEIQATGRSTRLTIMLAPNDRGPAWIDSVNLVAIPEPSALALFTLSGGFILCQVTRRRKHGPGGGKGVELTGA